MWISNTSIRQPVFTTMVISALVVFGVAADIGHYVADMHQPLHLTRNYNGQLTGNYGIHARYEGQMIALLGANGAGKTTTINMLCTLLSPSGGRATVCGYDLVRQRSEVRRCIGLVFQEPEEHAHEAEDRGGVLALRRHEWPADEGVVGPVDQAVPVHYVEGLPRGGHDYKITPGGGGCPQGKPAARGKTGRRA
jgi:hypothetical protein